MIFLERDGNLLSLFLYQPLTIQSSIFYQLSKHTSEPSTTLGYKTHSAVGKKLQKLKDKFYNLSKETEPAIESETKTSE